MKLFNRSTGNFAEDIAAKALQDRGYLILKRNFQNRFGEIDIIAKDKDILVFIEVKAKKGLGFGLPEEMVSPGKIRRIRKMAEVYLQGRVLPCRIDIIAIILSPENAVLNLNHYENVY